MVVLRQIEFTVGLKQRSEMFDRTFDRTVHLVVWNKEAIGMCVDCVIEDCKLCFVRMSKLRCVI